MLEELTPAATTAALVQIVILLVGLVVLWRVQFAPGARTAKVSRLGRWEIGGLDFMLACVVVLAGGSVAQVALGQVLGRLTAPIGDDLQIVLGGAAFQIGLFAGALIAARIVGPRSPGPVNGEAPGEAHRLLAGTATFAAAMPLLLAISLPWNALLERLGFSTDKQQLVELFARADSPVLVVIVASLAIVVAPVTEELLFRAGLFRYLRTRIPRPLAIGLPAVLFALLHGNLAAFAPLVALGIIFALAYERTGRIAVPIVAHALFNLNTILLLLAGVLE